MDGHTFDALTRVLGKAPTRRALLPVFGSLFAASWLGGLPTSAKKKKKKKTTLCLDGQTIEATKKKKKKLLKSGATPGACPSSPPPPPGCTAACEGKPCGGDDGCGGTCGCAAGSVCHAGVCQACTIICSGSGSACGNELKTTLAIGGTIYACPGRYVGSFTIDKDLVLIGAGDGDDPAANTILDANGTARVMDVNAGVTAALHGLRITGGDDDVSGGGIRNLGTLTLTACTIDTNHAGVIGGGIYNETGATELRLNDCLVSGNKADVRGGGIANGTDVTTTINGSTISGNDADFGGGLFNFGTTIFDNASSVIENTSRFGGGGITNNAGGVVTLNGAIVSGNTPVNCENVDDCVD